MTFRRLLWVFNFSSVGFRKVLNASSLLSANGQYFTFSLFLFGLPTSLVLPVI